MSTASLLPIPQRKGSMSNKLDRSLLQQVAEGESASFEAFLNQYGQLVWTLAIRMIKSHSEAEDATQEIFLKLWQSAHRFDPSVGTELQFVSMVARRHLIDRLRRQTNRTPSVSLDETIVQPESVAHEDPLEKFDEVAKAKRCLRHLTQSVQKILSLSIQHALSHTQIANQLQLPLGSVKSAARRGLLQLRDCMQRPNSDSPSAVPELGNPS